jgi:cell wall-associated NlpC family hydrolase
VTLHTKRPHRSRLKQALRKRLRTTLTTATAATAGALMALALSNPAWAVPSPAEIEAQIDQIWNQLEPVIEQHNMIRVDLNAKKAQAQSLATQIQPLQEKVEAALTQVSAISVQYYKGGPASSFNALLTTGSPTTLADQLSLINMLARHEQTRLKDVVALKAQLDAQKKPLDALVVELTAKEADLAAKEKSINAEIKRLNDLRLQTYGAGGGTGSLRPVACPFEYVGGPAGVAAQTACNQVGKPYVWGADGPGSFDCSGLTMYAWAAAGKRLRHYTMWQFQDTQRISRAELRPGDLVFFYGDLHHVGMYMGGGWMVHASRPSVPIKMAKIDSSGPITGYGRVRL